MATAAIEQRTYRPHFIHAFFAGLDRLPWPSWLSLLLLLPAIGILQHLVAYSKGLLAWGEVNFDLATAGYWLIGPLLLVLYMLKAGKEPWEDIQPLLNLSEEEYVSIYFNFFTIPTRSGNVIFLIGGLLGALNGIADMAVAPAVDYAFPELRIGIWITGSAVLVLVLFQLIRQLSGIKKVYSSAVRADIFHQQPLYGFPRYTAMMGIWIFIYGYLAPVILDPTAFASQTSILTTALIGPLVLLLFYLPLAGMHNRLVREKEALLQETGSRIRTILREIHQAAFEEKEFSSTGAMIAVHTVLLKEKEAIQDLSTWPWRPGTVRGLLSALLLPVLLSILRDVISGWLGL